MKERYKFIIIASVFIAVYFVPFSNTKVRGAVYESLMMLQEYARQHVLFCLVSAFFIAGAIGVFISQASVIKYFGAETKKWLSYGVASVSGSVLAVCSCTVLPLFAGIYSRGAGIGPATAFLYSGPAINVLAIALTARILGWQFGVARAAGAIVFSVVAGLLMAAVFRGDEKSSAALRMPEEKNPRPLWKMALFLFSMVLLLVFAAWGKPKEPAGLASLIYRMHWYGAGIFLVLILGMLGLWFSKSEVKEWSAVTWGFTKQILPLLFFGVLAAGFLMGRPGTEGGIIPGAYVQRLVGGNSLGANLFASVAGALMYFATLTEVPILQGLLGSGMGKGPALAMLLAGPALSLPNMLVIRSVIGTKKTLTYVLIVVVLATISGKLFGMLYQ